MTGNLRGFDQFMNIVLDNTVEEVSETERNDIGLVVRRLVIVICPRRAQPKLTRYVFVAQVIRGNSIVMMECLERI